MVTVKEEITVTHDDKLAEEYEKQLTEKDGWKRTDTTVSTTYSRVRYLNMRGETE